MALKDPEEVVWAHPKNSLGHCRRKPFVPTYSLERGLGRSSIGIGSFAKHRAML